MIRHVFALMSGFVLSIALIASHSAMAATYYVHPVAGRDDSDGTTPESAWKTLERISSVDLQAGDEILLAAGQTHAGSIEIHNVAGTSASPILVSSYETDSDAEATRAVIDAKGQLAGVYVENASFVKIENLEIYANGGGQFGRRPEHDQAMRVGVLVRVTKRGKYEGIHLNNLDVHDIFFERRGFVRPSNEVKTANGTQSYGWGIRFINNTENSLLSHVWVNDSQVWNVAHTGIKFTAKKKSIQFIEITGNDVSRTGGPGIQMSGVSDAQVAHNSVDRSGSADDSRKWGRGSGLWTWNSSRVIIEHNRFTNANGPADSAGVHIDFNCANVIVQYNFSANNAGGFCEILGNNYHNAYRYNVSVNDGFRIKGQNDAFQEGKTIWLSGYTGEGPRSGPFNSYIYNNTIYADDSVSPKYAIDKTARGVLIANNILYVKGDGHRVLGDQYKPEMVDGPETQTVVVQNNLYLHALSWPAQDMVQDRSPLFGDPKFVRNGGMAPGDYRPTKLEAVKDKGMVIGPLVGDPNGLAVGFEVETDILGNPISGLPDLGAIEVSE